ncbi:MAG: hypothetical protein WCP01_16835 [Methylococcaceae bacterium]
MRKMELFEAIKRNCLPDYLSILQWERLMYPDPDNRRDSEDHIKKRVLTLDRQIEHESLIAACKNGLPYQGDIKGWKWEWEWGTNPYPSTDNGIFVRGESQVSAENIGIPWEVCHPCDCVIHKSVMQSYLKNKGKWPLQVEGLHDSWWTDDEQAAETETETEGNHAPDERQSQLHIFIWRAHQALSQLKRPTAQQVWNEMQHRHKTHDTDKIIQEVNGQEILWCSGYGNEQKLQRTSFDKTLSNIRKNPPF